MYDIVLTSHLGYGKLPYRDGFFGAVVSQQAFSFCPDRLHSFSEMYRILTPGGVLAFQDLFLSRAEGVMLHASPVEEAFGLVLGTIKDYKSDLAKAGFVDVKVVNVHDIADHIGLQRAMTEKSASGAFRPSSPQVQHPGLVLSDLEPGGEMFKFGDVAVANALAHNALGLSVVTARKPTRKEGQAGRLSAT
jgi:SAM-dependent methyltransferase